MIHPEEETKSTCAMCSYFLKVPTKLHKLDTVKLFRKTMYYSFINESSKKSEKYCKKLNKFYLNAQPL